MYGDNNNNKITSHLDVQGVLYSWGTNNNNQLGLDINNLNHRSTPKIIKYLRNISIINISSSGYHTIAITSYGNVYVWGNNSDGRLGLGFCNNPYKPYIKKPTLLSSLKNINIISSTASLDHSTLLTQNGNIYVFGCDRNSKIINYTKKQMNMIWTKKLEPFCITDKINNTNNNIRYVSSSFERIIMITNENKLYFIGRSFNNKKITTPLIINSISHKTEFKKIGIQSACIGDNFLIILLMNGLLLSRNKNSTNTRSAKFFRIINEIPTVILIVVVFLAIFKPI